MSRFINSNILILVFFVFFSACATVPSREEPPLQVVSRVDIKNILEDGMKLRAILTGFRKTVMP